MPIISDPQAFNEEDLYVDLRSMFGRPLFLKCEGFNFAGSIKLKAAAEMVEAAERDGLLTPWSVRVRQPARVAQPVRQSGQLEGALPQDRAGDRARVPATRRPVRRGRHHRD